MDQDPKDEEPDYDDDPDESPWCLQVKLSFIVFLLKHFIQ
jgi:hypothetical protein